ncbi:MAG: hypothetical protein NXI32_14995 [bacterium]|nr:hypothetical protein [bacterium]
MDIQILQEALDELPFVRENAAATEVQKLAQLIDGDLPLQSFLEALLPELTALFGGVAAVAWMKAAGAPGAVFGIRYRMESVVSTVTEQRKHERLVQIAWQQRQPMLAEPTGKLRQAIESENPTEHALVFGPVLHSGEPVALLEIVLAKLSKPLSKAEKHLYLKAIRLIADRVYGGLRSRMSMPKPTLKQAVDQIQQLSEEIRAMQMQIVRSIEARLQQFHGWSFESLSENQAFAKLVHQILDSHGLRVQCPECGHPAILRCLRAGNAKHGAFVFDHYLETGRTFHGGPTTVPLIKVVAKPARRAALSNPA